MNIWDILLSAAIVAALALAVAFCIRKKKRGGGCHGGSCTGCQGSCGNRDK